MVGFLERVGHLNPIKVLVCPNTASPSTLCPCLIAALASTAFVLLVLSRSPLIMRIIDSSPCVLRQPCLPLHCAGCGRSPVGMGNRILSSSSLL